MSFRSLLSSRRRELRGLAFSLGLVTAAVAVVLGWKVYSERQRRELLMQAIQQVGGSASFAAPQTTDGHILSLLARLGIRGTERYRDRCELLLNGDACDDAWLEQLDQLRGLPVSGVIVVRSRLSADGLCRFVTEHQVEFITAPGIPLTDSHAARWASQSNLRRLNLNRTEITDAAIPLLKPQQLGSLYVGGTHVTAQGLELLRGSTQLGALGMDGCQFGKATDDFFSSLPQLQSLVLIGGDVTDDHLARVAAMPGIRSIYLERTAVTPEGAARFRESRPDCLVQMPRPGTEVIPWRTDVEE